MDNTAPPAGRPDHIAPSRGKDGYVAVVGQWRKDGLTVFPVRYAETIQAAGADPIVISTFDPPAHYDDTLPIISSVSPHDPSVLKGATGLVLPGGGDIDPAWYGAPRHPRTRNVSHRRDQFERTLLEDALERDLPILAICHGMQMLNVHLGGSLVQHLGDNPSHLSHDEDLPRSEPVHSIRVKEDSFLAGLWSAREIAVNSHHHQGLDHVAEQLEEVAWADDGVLEAVESSESSWVIGVQWHPEAMAGSDKHQLALFESFVEATRAYEGGQSTALASA